MYSTKFSDKEATGPIAISTEVRERRSGHSFHTFLFYDIVQTSIGAAPSHFVLKSGEEAHEMLTADATACEMVALGCMRLMAAALAPADATAEPEQSLLKLIPSKP